MSNLNVDHPSLTQDDPLDDFEPRGNCNCATITKTVYVAGTGPGCHRHA